MFQSTKITPPTPPSSLIPLPADNHTISQSRTSIDPMKAQRKNLLNQLEQAKCQIDPALDALQHAQQAPGLKTTRYWLGRFATLRSGLVNSLCVVRRISLAAYSVTLTFCDAPERIPGPDLEWTLSPAQLVKLISDLNVELQSLRYQLALLHTAMLDRWPDDMVLDILEHFPPRRAPDVLPKAIELPVTPRVIIEEDPRFGQMDVEMRTRIRATTFKGMVEHLLTAQAVLDPEYETMFFVFLSAFASPDTLVHELAVAYTRANGDELVRLRVGKALLKWVTLYWRTPRDPTVEDDVRKFASEVLRKDQAALSYEITIALDKLHLPHAQRSPPVFNHNRATLSSQPSIWTLRTSSVGRLMLQDFRKGDGPRRLAGQLTLFVQESWKSISPEDFVLYHAGLKTSGQVVEERLRELLVHGEHMKGWVKTSIMGAKNVRSMNTAFELWATVGKICLNMANFCFSRAIDKALKQLDDESHPALVKSSSRWALSKHQLTTPLHLQETLPFGAQSIPFLPDPAQVIDRLKAAQKPGLAFDTDSGMVDLGPFREMSVILHMLERTRVEYPIEPIARVQLWIRNELNAVAFTHDLKSVAQYHGRSAPSAKKTKTEVARCASKGSVGKYSVSEDTLVGKT